MKLTYPTEFAEATQGTGFSNGSRMRALINKAGSTFQEFTEDAANWKSETGRAYTEKEMRSLWMVIGEAKARVQAWWLIRNGAFIAYNPARASLGAVQPAA